jgi:large subunit ribosomal protein L31
VNSGVTTTGQILERLAQGDDKLLAIDGFGRKSLADLKKRLRQMGYELPQTPDQAVT